MGKMLSRFWGYFFKKNKSEQEKIIKFKISFLRLGTYLYYLNKELVKNKDSVDIPSFLYINGNALNTNALRLTEFAINQAKQQGVKHIDKCFARLTKIING